MSRSFALFAPIFAFALACNPNDDCDAGFILGADGNCYQVDASTDDGTDGGDVEDGGDDDTNGEADTDEADADQCDASGSEDAEGFDFTWDRDESSGNPCVTVEGRAKGDYGSWEVEISLAEDVEVLSVESGGLNVDVFGDTIFVEGTRVRAGDRVTFTVCSDPGICPTSFSLVQASD